MPLAVKQHLPAVHQPVVLVVHPGRPLHVTHQAVDGVVHPGVVPEVWPEQGPSAPAWLTGVVECCWRRGGGTGDRTGGQGKSQKQKLGVRMHYDTYTYRAPQQQEQ